MTKAPNKFSFGSKQRPVLDDPNAVQKVLAPHTLAAPACMPTPELLKCADSALLNAQNARDLAKARDMLRPVPDQI